MNLQVQPATFLKRYKRFFADVQLPNGEIAVAHVANSGSLKTCLCENSPCLVTHHAGSDRKLNYSLRAIKSPTGWSGVDTSLPNPLVDEALFKGLIADWLPYRNFQREVKISDSSRIDFVLFGQQKSRTPERVTKALKFPDYLKSVKPLHFIEVKNVTYLDGSIAQFPDAVTERGQKHLDELMALTKQGHVAELVFVVQRTEAQSFGASPLDPVYAQKFKRALAAGVRVKVLKCEGWRDVQGEETLPLSLGHKELPFAI